MSVWKNLVTASLLGTEKGGATTTLPASLESVLGPAGKLNPEAQFLTRAGALALWRRAGWKSFQAKVAVAPACPSDGQPLVNPTSIVHLRTMLGGHCVEALPEWLGEVARLGKRVPPELLPALLDWARQNRARHLLVVSAGGERVRWLATLNPAWNFAADDAPERWETGGREQRVAILRGWRTADPALAREKLAAVWKTEPAEVRQAFLDVLAEAPSDADAPFLETTLDDRSKEVRVRTVELLGRLAASAFAARMTARAEPLLTFRPGGLLRRSTLEIELPGEPDAAAKRDGLDPKVLPIPRTVGDKSYLLAQILAAVPLPRWTERFQQTPEALLKAAARHEFASAVISGWALAALAQRDAAWNRAFFDELPDLTKHLFVRHDGFFNLLPRAYQIERAVAQLHATPLTTKTDASEPTPKYYFQLADLPGYLPEEVAKLALDQLQRIPRGESEKLPNYSLPNTAQNLAAKTPPSLLATFAADWPTDIPAFARAFDLLTFRRDALAALAQI